VVWQPKHKKFTLVERVKTFQDGWEFKATHITDDLYAEMAIYRDGLVVTASRTDVVLLTTKGLKIKIHSSVGSILDFHVGKDMVFIENYEGKSTRLF
jgi:hypothetical protein